jgi:hypothetical protein
MADIWTSPQRYFFESTILSLLEDRRRAVVVEVVSRQWEARWERMADLKDHRSVMYSKPCICILIECRGIDIERVPEQQNRRRLPSAILGGVVAA